jgi:hypothetical protein
MTANFDRADWIALGGLMALLAALAGMLYLLVHRTGEAYDSHEALLAIAGDAGQTADARGEAVFRLFANYLRPNADAARVREVFGDCDWVAEAQVETCDYHGSPSHPLRTREAGSLFAFDLFVPKGKCSDWIIYVRFSGYNHSPEEVRRFFSPNAEPDTQLRITEFALWNYRTRQQEVFDATGRHPPKYP